jgi:hypothetical protein
MLLALINVGIYFLLASAYKNGEAVIVASFDYSYLIFTLLWW